MIRLLVVLLMLAIVVSLFSGLFFLYRDPSGSTRTVRLLTLRMVLSITLFLVLMAAFRFGFIPGYTQ